MLFTLNAIIAVCCVAIAGIEYTNGHNPVALAYAGFGTGYLGLTWLYLGG